MIKNILEKMKEGHYDTFSSTQVFDAFKQGVVDLPLIRSIGGGGNCASIALIKCVIRTFGFARIFKSVIADDSRQRFLIDLKDENDFIYSLAFEDYEFGAHKSAFELKKNDETSVAIYEYAKFLFAVMAEVKRQTYRARNNYKRAVTDLNKGEQTDTIYEMLGLNAQDVQDVTIAGLTSRTNLVLYSPVHAVYSNQGFYDECVTGYQSAEPLRTLQKAHGDGSDYYQPVGAFTLS